MTGLQDTSCQSCYAEKKEKFSAKPFGLNCSALNLFYASIFFRTKSVPPKKLEISGLKDYCLAPMSSNPDLQICLDLGSSSVRVLAGIPKIDPNTGSLVDFDLMGLGIRPSYGLRKGQVVNSEALVDSIKSAVKECEKQIGSKIRASRLSVSGVHIKGFNSSGVVAVHGKEVSQEDIDRVLESSQAFSLAPGTYFMYAIPQDFVLDGVARIESPIGKAGVRLESKVHLITASLLSVTKLIETANLAGIKIETCAFSGLCGASIVMTPEEKEQGTLGIDIGAGLTNLVAFSEGAPVFTGVIARGGDKLTNELALACSCSISVAEEIKRGYAYAYSKILTGDDSLELPADNQRNLQVVSIKLISEVIEKELRALFAEARNQIISELGPRAINQVVLYGGSSALKGMEELASECFGIATRVVTTNFKGLDDSLATCELSTTLGLSALGQQLMPKKPISPGGASKAASNIWKGASAWLAEHF